MTRSRFHQIFESFSRKRILVIGDLMLDEFIWGNVKRISPEAPVPVVEVERESYFPGGAANVARNLREFAGDVHVMGLIGTDSHAEHLKHVLHALEMVAPVAHEMHRADDAPVLQLLERGAHV